MHVCEFVQIYVYFVICKLFCVCMCMCVLVSVYISCVEQCVPVFACMCWFSHDFSIVGLSLLVIVLDCSSRPV